MAPFLVLRPADRRQPPRTVRGGMGAAIAREWRALWSMTPLAIVLRALARDAGAGCG